ncbi:MAG TPA: hypothetical protein VF601_23360 [Beijerinckiaceae bacterium]|jgi:hypothetical protein
MLSALAPLAGADARPEPRGARPGLLCRTLAVARVVVEIWNEAQELRRTLSRRYPFADF